GKGDSKAVVWMSRRWGISIPWSSLANEICFINSGMNHLQAQIALPRLPRNFRGSGAERAISFSCSASEKELGHIVGSEKVSWEEDRGCQRRQRARVARDPRSCSLRGLAACKRASCRS